MTNGKGQSERSHQRQAKGARVFAIAKIVPLLTVRWMSLLALFKFITKQVFGIK
jgi:hypothetical protein